MKPRLLKPGFPHKPGGNCWEKIQSPQAEDVCMKHRTGRGECSQCPRCPACDNLHLAQALTAPEKPPLALVPPPTREFWPSASKTDLLFACTWPFGRRVRAQAVGERTRFGSAFHEGMEQDLGGCKKWKPKAIAKKWDVDPDEVKSRVMEAAPVIWAWLGGKNDYGLNFLKAGLKLEQSAAFDPRTGGARFLPGGPGEDHSYPECERPREIPSTVDVASLVVGRKGLGLNPLIKTLLILDHKSGWQVAPGWAPQTPAENGQLRTLACAFAKLYDADEVIVAFFHAPVNGQPLVMSDRLTVDDLNTHRKALRAAMGNIGSGWMRPGAWCATCPAYSVCPTQTSALAELKRTPGALTAEKAGAIHQGLADYARLAKILDEEIRAWVKANGPAVRPDGKEVDFIPRGYSSLSQASIKRALGPAAGARMIEKLRALGCIDEGERLELRTR